MRLIDNVTRPLVWIALLIFSAPKGGGGCGGGRHWTLLQDVGASQGVRIRWRGKTWRPTLKTPAKSLSIRSGVILQQVSRLES